jgi:hypothetical protein
LYFGEYELDITPGLTGCQDADLGWTEIGYYYRIY